MVKFLNDVSDEFIKRIETLNISNSTEKVNETVEVSITSEDETASSETVSEEETNSIPDLPEKVNEAVAIPVTSEDETDNNESVSEEETLSIPAASKDVSMEVDIPEEIKAIIRANKDISIVCHKIAVYLKMLSYEEFFENFLIEAFKLEEFEINWNNIKELLDIRHIKEPAKCTRTTVSTKIANMMKQHNIPSMGVKLFTILVVKYYKEYWKSSNNNEVKTEEVKPEETEKDKPFEGLPENAIFNEKISQMPRELAEVDKIKYIFNDALDSKVDYQFASKLYQILSDNDSENFEDALSFELRAEIAEAIYNVWPEVKVKDFLTSLKKFVFN